MSWGGNGYRLLSSNRNPRQAVGHPSPVRLDDYIIDGWEHERKADVVKKVIADARDWDKDSAKYNKVRDKLIKDLKRA